MILDIMCCCAAERDDSPIIADPTESGQVGAFWFESERARAIMSLSNKFSEDKAKCSSIG